MAASPLDRTPASSARQFHTTRWTIVRAAGAAEGDGRDDALAQLCGAYWYPLYAYLRRRGHDPEESADLTQGFFAELLAGDGLARVEREGGRFRSWLLGALRNHVNHMREYDAADRRGGGRETISIDAVQAESRYRLEPVDEHSPEELYERRWALTVLERALKKLRDEHAARRKEDWFEALKSALTEPAGGFDYAASAARLETTPGALRVAVHRLRKRYRELIRLEVADTLGADEDQRDELQRVVAALSGRS